MRFLRPHLASLAAFAGQVERQQRQGYHLLAAWRKDEVAGLAGWREQESLVHGHHLYIDDLVVLPDHRCRGLGKQLLDTLIRQASALGCSKLVLDTAVANVAAHRFYERAGFANTALRYTLPLSPKPTPTDRQERAWGSSPSPSDI